MLWIWLPNTGKASLLPAPMQEISVSLPSMIQLLESRSPGAEAELIEELQILLNDDTGLFENIEAKKKLLASYTQRCRHRISGRRIAVRLSELAENLERKADWLTGHLQNHEWIDGGTDEGWFNSYYDDHGRAVEGFFPNEVRMMLTGQVFSIMGNVASEQQIRRIVNSADHYLYRKGIGGYRLNTDSMNSNSTWGVCSALHTAKKKMEPYSHI